MTQLSDDCFAFGDGLTPVDEALRQLDARLEPVASVQRLGTDQCLGRILAEDVISPVNIPPRANSAVDGYAVRFDDLNADAETRLPIAGRVAAGHPLEGGQARETASRIFTGAVMPVGQGCDGPDTVFMQEDCRIEGDTVILPPGIKRGANARSAGEDVTAGSVVLTRGTRFRPQDIGMAAAVGRTTLDVYEPLRVAVFSTGDELCDPGQDAPEGHIYDSNRTTLKGVLRATGCRVTDLGILADDPDLIRSTLDKAAEGHDVIVTSGGMSVGEEDHLKPAVEALGSLHFWRLAIKPGRPVALGQIRSSVFVGLPGNPVAAMVTFLRIARPAILRLAGAGNVTPRLFPVIADFDYKKKEGRREFVRVALSDGESDLLVARRFERDGAGVLSSMVAADGLVELEEGRTNLKAGETVMFLPFTELGL